MSYRNAVLYSHLMIIKQTSNYATAVHRCSLFSIVCKHICHHKILHVFTNILTEDGDIG